jgi:hypothetical protein
VLSEDHHRIGERRGAAVVFAGVLVIACVGGALASPRVAHADGIVLEAYTGARPDGATRLLAPVLDELGVRGFAGRETLGKSYAAKVSHPASAPGGLPTDFELGVERGHKAWIAGRFDDAIAQLTPLVSTAHANTAVIAQSQALREKVQKALIALALSLHRKNEVAEARAVLREMLRSYPDSQMPRAIYGPDAFALYEDVRRGAAREAKGKLVVKANNDAAVVFVNEKFAEVGGLQRGDLIPGVYRVYVQFAKRTSRAHLVEVKADAEASLTIDLDYDATVRTGGWTGFEFASAGQRDKHEARYAVRFARALGATGVVVVGIDQSRGRASVVGSLLELKSGRELRRASLALEPGPTEARLRSLARFLAGDDAASGLDVEINELRADEDDDDGGAARDDASVGAGSDRRWMLWAGLGLGAVGAAAGGGLAVKFVLDAGAAGEEIDRRCAVACTPEELRPLEREQAAANRNAVIAGVAGGLVVVTGVVFIVSSRLGSKQKHVAVVPTRDGVMAGLWGSF